MEKELRRKEIFNQISILPFFWKDIKDLSLEDNDQINIQYVEPWENGSDNSGGDYFEISVYRMVLETDEEFEKRKKAFEDYQIISKKQRFEQFLKLRVEFDSEVKKIKNE